MGRILLFIATFLLSVILFITISITIQHKYQYVSVMDTDEALRQWEHLPFDFSNLKEGDLVLRSGRSFFSDQLRKFSKREAKYSHCGFITSGSDGKLYVYHSIGGNVNPESQLRKESISSFCNPLAAREFGFFRYDLTDKERAGIDSLASVYFGQRMEFDMKFSIEDDTKMYCSELIYNVLTVVTNNIEFLNLSVHNGKRYVAIDDLYLNNKCQKIFDYEYN